MQHSDHLDASGRSVQPIERERTDRLFWPILLGLLVGTGVLAGWIVPPEEEFVDFLRCWFLIFVVGGFILLAAITEGMLFMLRFVTSWILFHAVKIAAAFLIGALVTGRGDVWAMFLGAALTAITVLFIFLWLHDEL